MDEPLIKIEYRKVTWAFDRLLKGNAQEHDLDKLELAFRIYGFRDPVSYDPTVKAIIEGNGRVMTLYDMEQRGVERPKYITEDEDGDWCLPINLGASSANIEEAYRYSLDHNFATMAGGDFSTADKAKMMNHLALLEMFDTIGSSLFMDEGEVAFLRLRDADTDGLTFPEEPEAETGEPEIKRVVLKMTPEQHETYTSMLLELEGIMEQKDPVEIINLAMEAYTG